MSNMLRHVFAAVVVYGLSSAVLCAQANFLIGNLANVTANAGSHVAPEHLILTIAFGMENKKLCTFMRSWHLHGTEAQLVLFIGKDDKPPVQHPRLRIVTVTTPCPNNMTIYVYRNYIYEAFLRGLPVWPLKGVMLTDMRDVIIQAPIWTHHTVSKAIDRDSVIFSLEGNPKDQNMSNTRSIESEEWNRNWIKGCFGEEVGKLMGPTPISCAGVVIGSNKAIRGYLSTLISVFENRATTSESCAQMGGGADQGVHNYLLHYMGPRGLLPFNIVMEHNGPAPVYTTFFGMPAQIDYFGFVDANRNGLLFRPPVIHQYTRSTDLTIAVHHAYACVEPRQINRKALRAR